jgi:3-oxoacyl-[acyl-carrier-protein] synthase-3
MTRYAHIIGWGMAVPERVLTNSELEKMVDTTDEWIVTRTGIRERHIAGKHDSTATLSAQAARRALAMTPLAPKDIQLIIVATATPEHMFPATACLVQDSLGAVNAGAFDLMAACSGFICALNMAASAIRSGATDNAVVIGGETLSRFVDWQDRTTAILFGDGAGAVVLQASDEPGGVMGAVMRSDGSGANLLEIPAGGSQLPPTADTVARNLHTIQMNGREVFRFATRVMASATKEAVARSGLQLEDIELVVPHQANLRIIEAAARGLHLPMERFYVNIQRYGNTSSASIPMAICEAVAEHRIHPGDHLVLVGFGAGLTWGSIVVQWVETRPAAPRRGRALASLGARLSSLLRRIWRRIEGLIWGATSGPGK